MKTTEISLQGAYDWSKLTIVPVVVSLIIIYIWSILEPEIKSLYHINRDDRGVFEWIIGAPLSVFFGFGGYIIGRLIKRNGDMEFAYNSGEKKKFVCLRDVRNRKAFHGIQASLAFILLFLVFIYPFDSKIFGMTIVFLIALIMVAGLAFAIELNNPFTGIIKINVPSNWQVITLKDVNREEEIIKSNGHLVPTPSIH